MSDLIKVAIVSDKPESVALLRSYLDYTDDLVCVHTTSHIEQAQQQIENGGLQNLDGIVVACDAIIPNLPRLLNSLALHVKIVVVFELVASELVYLASHPAVSGVVHLSCAPKLFIDALRAIGQGGKLVLDPSYARIFINRALAQTQPVDLSSYGFSQDQLQVVNCILAGMTNDQIAATLGLSVPGVKKRLRMIFRVTGANNRLELVAILNRTQTR